MGNTSRTTEDTFVVYGLAHSLLITLIGMQLIKVRAMTDAKFFSFTNSALNVRTKCWPARERCHGAIKRQPAKSRASD
jgi:hypothetical protein